MSGQTSSFHPSPGNPKQRLPKGACDSHVHVFGPSAVFPYAKDAPFVPADAPKDMLFAMHAALGIEHCVIVQSTCHGFDNSVVADAIKAKNGAYCGIALAPASVDGEELKRLDGQGFAPFGRVIDGMNIVDQIFSGYGEAPDQKRIELEGNAYLEKEFPNLDYIKTASILE